MSFRFCRRLREYSLSVFRVFLVNFLAVLLDSDFCYTRLTLASSPGLRNFAVPDCSLLEMARFVLAMEAIHEEKIGRKRRRRRMRDNFNYRSIPDPEFINNYRLNKSLFEDLCQELIPLMPSGANCAGIEPHIKILTALNFFARGSYQGSVGNNSDAPMAQQTVSRCIRDVTTALNTAQIVSKFIKFPQNRVERNGVKAKFYQKYSLPGVCGCIDCTHIAIVRPVEDEERFFNRKSYHSLNVQMICDVDNYILNVDARYGGASHDSFIWNNSELKAHMEELTSRGEIALLLGDSGYPLREYLITPYSEPEEGSPQETFNEIQKRARSTIERTFGILKGRFRCLLAARELHYDPNTSGKITIACCVLHNLCIRQDVTVPELTEAEIQNENRRQPTAGMAAPSSSSQVMQQRGIALREQLAQQLHRRV